MYYKVYNTYYKVCNMYYKVCNKKISAQIGKNCKEKGKNIKGLEKNISEQVAGSKVRWLCSLALREKYVRVVALDEEQT